MNINELNDYIIIKCNISY